MKEPKDQPFESNLSAFIKFWSLMGCPDLTVLYRVLFWEDHEHNRQEAGRVVGLSGCEAIRKMIAHLAKIYRKNTNPNPPDQSLEK